VTELVRAEILVIGLIFGLLAACPTPQPWAGKSVLVWCGRALIAACVAAAALEAIPAPLTAIPPPGDRIAPTPHQPRWPGPPTTLDRGPQDTTARAGQPGAPVAPGLAPF
jgi:hypothetical protein